MPLKVTPETKHFFVLQPISSCPKCGSQDYLISESGKMFICEKCGYLSRNHKIDQEPQLNQDLAGDNDMIH
ncbi:TFIIB-type zinc ribbon-containing protein [Vibrio tapetis subsp. quintayensis]|uniref:TFIIB-type zinc ribbon-containing protein n=1 Tax=Vibrio tapetis TaxID=52443 RepID=UPI0025B3FD3A|nr:TFIIB-type zinc ribbon-containing protein [Vibrio tapetis]MDN3681192.1 TFIIB-type zinc ribbon-containing protein [Vibrio tapetis subsp. quintayensis]